MKHPYRRACLLLCLLGLMLGQAEPPENAAPDPAAAEQPTTPF